MHRRVFNKTCQGSLLKYQGWFLVGLPYRHPRLFCRGRTAGKTTEHVAIALGSCKASFPSATLSATRNFWGLACGNPIMSWDSDLRPTKPQ